MKNSVLDNFPLCPPAHPPLKNANFIFIVVSLSLRKSGQPWDNPPVNQSEEFLFPALRIF